MNRVSGNGNRTGSILVKTGKITNDQLDKALNEQEKIQPRHHFSGLSVKLGFASDENVAQALAEQLKIAFFELTEDFRLALKR